MTNETHLTLDEIKNLTQEDIVWLECVENLMQISIESIDGETVFYESADKNFCDYFSFGLLNRCYFIYWDIPPRNEIESRLHGVRRRKGGPQQLYCYDCGEWVKNTHKPVDANDTTFWHDHRCDPYKIKESLKRKPSYDYWR